MSLRKAKLLLEQKKLQEEKRKIQQQEEEEQQHEEVVVQKKSAFTFEGFGDDDSESQKQEKTQSKKVEQNEVDVKDQEKKKKKKKKKKKITEEEELQKTFKQLGMHVSKQSLQQKHEPKVWQSIFAIHESKFNYEKQLKRHFRNWEEDMPEKDPELDRRQQKMQKHLRKLMKKSVLSPGIKEYFPIGEKFEVERTEDGKIKFMPTKKYEHFQVEYEAIRNSNDINALFQFTQMHPEHVDSLYYVGEFLRLQGNYRDADSLIQRVIYIYEMAGSYDIMEFIKQDVMKKQVVYDSYSKSLFMSIFKFMDILGKKGCFRTALEYNKLLLKMNLADPSACLLTLDYNAISAGQSEFLVDFVTYYSHYMGDKAKSLYLMPNFIYSFALAKYNIENKKSAKNESDMVVEENNLTELILFTEEDWKEALKLPSDQSFIKENCRVLILRAIMVYPKLIFDIAQKNEYSKQFLNHPKFAGYQKKGFKNILQHEFWTMIPQSYSYHFLGLQSEADSRGLDKVLDVYVERSKILWKSNDVMLWVKGALGFVLNQLQAQFNYQQFLENLCTQQCGGLPIPFSLARYENVSRANFSDRVQRIDLNNIQDNAPQQQPQNANRMNLEGNGFRLFLNSLLPWVNLPANNQQNDPNQPEIEEDD